MKTQLTLTEMAQEIERQQNAKRDFVVPTQQTQMAITPNEGRGQTVLAFGDQTLAINDTAHAQIGEHVGIPKAYYDKMRADAPGLLCDNVNTWFNRYPAVRMVRSLDDKARAFLSDKYRPLDNADFVEAALPPLLKAGVDIVSCAVTEKKLYLKVVDSKIKADLPMPLGQGHGHFRTISPALVLSNSEVGYGAMSLETSVWEEGCTNLMVIKERSHRKYHIGGKHELGGEEVYAMLSNETKALTDKALWSQIGDMVGAAFDRARFDATVDKLKAAGSEKITTDPVKVVELTAKKFGMNEGERGSVLRHLIEGGDLSQYGLQWAVTRAANDLESYDRASEFERFGGQIVELGKAEFRELVKA